MSVPSLTISFFNLVHSQCIPSACSPLSTLSCHMMVLFHRFLVAFPCTTAINFVFLRLLNLMIPGPGVGFPVVGNP